MATYKAKENTYIHGRYYNTDDLIVVPDDFPIGFHLEPVDEAAKKAAKAAKAGGLVTVNDDGVIVKTDSLDQLMSTKTAETALDNAGGNAGAMPTPVTK